MKSDFFRILAQRVANRFGRLQGEMPQGSTYPLGEILKPDPFLERIGFL